MSQKELDSIFGKSPKELDNIYDMMEKHSLPVKKVVKELMQSGAPITCKEIFDDLGLSENESIVCRRAIRSLAKSDPRVTQFQPSVQTFYYSSHQNPVSSRIEATLALMRLNLTDYTFRSNKKELDEACSEIEKLLNKVLNPEFM